MDQSLRDHVIALMRGDKGHLEHEELIRGMIETLLRLTQNHTSRGDIKMLHTTLKEIRYAFKLFLPYREVKKVSVFGSARTAPSDPAYTSSALFAREIVRAGFMVITGAGDGIMRAAQEGAGRSRSFGMNILLPFEQETNEFIENDPKLITFKYFFIRKLFFVKEANAIALFPGGFGTQDEGFEVLTLLQTGKSNPMPVVMIDPPGSVYWKTWRAYVEAQFLSRGLISPDDMSLFKTTDRIEDAVDEITRFYRNYSSMRFVRDRLLIRLNHPIQKEMLDDLNETFSDIVVGDRIVESEPLPEEDNELETQARGRLLFCFNRKNFGRLRQMIDRINLYPIGHVDS